MSGFEKGTARTVVMADGAAAIAGATTVTAGAVMVSDMSLTVTAEAGTVAAKAVTVTAEEKGRSRPSLGLKDLSVYPQGRAVKKVSCVGKCLLIQSFSHRLFPGCAQESGPAGSVDNVGGEC